MGGTVGGDRGRTWVGHKRTWEDMGGDMGGIGVKGGWGGDTGDTQRDVVAVGGWGRAREDMGVEGGGTRRDTVVMGGHGGTQGSKEVGGGTWWP